MLYLFVLIASVAEKKQSIMDLIWDKKLKMSNYDRTSSLKDNKTPIHIQTLLGNNNTGPQTKRELNLLSNRLEKLFPNSGKN
jgi:hypothetical protein